MFRGTAVFIFQLHGDDGAAVFPEEPADLDGDFVVEDAGFFEVGGVAAADFQALGEGPVGDAAVADLAVAPRTAADDGFETGVAGGEEEGAEIAAAGPVEAALDFLVMAPKDIGSHNVDTAGLDFEKFFAPLGFGVARVVEFAHDGEPGFAVAEEAAGVEGERRAGGVGRGAHREGLGRGGGGAREGDGEGGGVGRGDGETEG